MSANARAIAALLAVAVGLPAVAKADDNQKAYWTLAHTTASSIELYKNETWAATPVRLTVCFEHYASKTGQPAPAVVVGQDPPVEHHLDIVLGGCSSASYVVNPKAAVVLTTSAAVPDGAAASGSYQITIP